MKITNTKERKVSIDPFEEGFLLVENVRYVPRGYTRGQWDEQRIWISAEEFDKIKKAQL